MNEKDFEDIIVKYPELIEDGLKFMGRQVHLYGRIMDILFQDKFGSKLIIELKNGPIKDKHMGQILSYEGMIISGDDPTVRVMLVGIRVPPNIQKALDHHGIAWKEIKHSDLKKFLLDNNDNDLLRLFEEERDGNATESIRLIAPQKVIHSSKPVLTHSAKVVPADLDKFWKLADEVITNAINSDKLHSKHVSTLIKRKGSHNKRDGYLSLRLCFGINIESRDLMYALADIGVYRSQNDTRVPKVTKDDTDIKEFDGDKNTYGVMIGTETGSKMIEFIREHLPDKY